MQICISKNDTATFDKIKINQYILYCPYTFFQGNSEYQGKEVWQWNQKINKNDPVFHKNKKK